tara:strand:- start:1760 stop:1999 length:240 start_codon:yes stop_codon:yes gene_type:complete
MGKVIDLFGDELPKCVVCEKEADRLIFDVHVCDSHAVSVASFVMEANRAMKLGGMSWEAMRRVVDFVATKRLIARETPN